MAYNISLSRKEIEYIIDYLLCPTNLYSSCDKRQDGYKLCDNLIKKLQKILTPIKKSSAKDKGRSLQKWVCQKIADLFGIEYNQQDDNCVIHSREMGQSGVDIIIRGDIKDFFPFSIECKSGEQLKLINTIRQIKKNTLEGNWWIIVHKKKAFKTPIVIMSWDCFYSLNKEILNGMDGMV